MVESGDIHSLGVATVVSDEEVYSILLSQWDASSKVAELK